MSLHLQPVTLAEAHAFVARHHRHHIPAVGGLFAVGCNDGKEVVGVAVIGRPVARALQDGYTAEVTRLATNGHKNACSMLYAAAWRACRALGYKRLGTYILKDEPGTSLLAAGWRCVGETGGGSWSVPSRPRVDKHPTQKKLRWEASAGRDGGEQSVFRCSRCGELREEDPGKFLHRHDIIALKPCPCEMLPPRLDRRPRDHRQQETSCGQTRRETP